MRRNAFIISCGIVFYLFATLNYPFLDLLIDQAKASGNSISESARGLISEDLLLSYTIKTHHWKVAPVVSSSQTTAEVTAGHITQKREVSASLQKPKPQEEKFVLIYVVKPGDTLNKISSKYGVKISTLSKLNGLKGDILPLGMKLKIMTTDGKKLNNICINQRGNTVETSL